MLNQESDSVSLLDLLNDDRVQPVLESNTFADIESPLFKNPQIQAVTYSYFEWVDFGKKAHHHRYHD